MLPNNFRPALAIEFSKVKTLPKNLLASPKLDGIRFCVFGGVAYSRSLKLIPNKFIQAYVKEHASALEGVDGEIIIGSPTAEDCFNVTTSGVMRIEGEPDFRLYVFDRYYSSFKYSERYGTLYRSIPLMPFRVKVVNHVTVGSLEDIEALEQFYLEKGYEGLMLNNADALYKCGRSGTKNPELIKKKIFTDSEFEIVGYEPKYTNQNEAQTNELGRTFRSTSKEGLVALETLGALILKTKGGSTFSCGSGFTDASRAFYWGIRDTLIGQFAKVKHFEIGALELPRFPIFLGIRDKIDM